MQSTAPLQVLNRKDRVGKGEKAVGNDGGKKFEVYNARSWYKPKGYSAAVEAKMQEQARARAEREQRSAARLQSRSRELTVPSRPSRSKREPTHSEVAAHNAANNSAHNQVQARNRHLDPRPGHLQFPDFAQPHRSASEDHPYRQVDAHRVGYSYSESNAHAHAPLDSSRHRSLSANAQYAPSEEEFLQAPALHPYFHPNSEFRPDVVTSGPAHNRAPSTTVTATTEPSRYSQSSWGESTLPPPFDFDFATVVGSKGGGGADVDEHDGSGSGLGSGLAMDGVSLDSGDSSAIYSRPINPTSVATVTRQRARIRKGLRLDDGRRDGSRSSGGDGQGPGVQRVRAKKKRERSLPPLPPPTRPSSSQVFSPPLDLESRPTTSEPAPQHSSTSGMTAHANPVHKPPRPPRPPVDASLTDYVDLQDDVVSSKPGPSNGVSATHQTKPKGPRGVMSASSRTGQSLRKEAFVPPTPMKNPSPLSEVAAYPHPDRDVGDGQKKMQEDERIVTLHGRLISPPMPLDRASSQTKGSPSSGLSSSSFSKGSASKLAPARPSNVHPKANSKGTPTPPRSYLRNNTGGVQDQRGGLLTYKWTSPSDPRSGSGSAPHKESSTSPSSPHYHKSSHSSPAVPPTSHSASSSTSSSSNSHSTSLSTTTVTTETTTTSAFHSARNVSPSAQSFTSLVRKAWRKVSFFSNSKKVHESQSADYVLWPATTMPVRQGLGGGAPSGAPITPIRLAVGGAVTRERSWSGGWGRMG